MTFLHPERVVQLGRPPNRIDLITSQSGVHFQDCYNRKTVETVENINVH